MRSEGGAETPGAAAVSDVRERILATAADLFYREGVRAVGVDLIVQRAGVAKTSLYRHFRTKDDLVEAFLKREDAEFWEHWDAVARRHAGDPAAELDAHLDWIAERIARPGYRGCPQLNVAAEFPAATDSAAEHPARVVARHHKQELRRRLQSIVERIGVARPAELGAQLALLVDGAFSSGPLLPGEVPAGLLRAAARALLDAARRPHPG